MSAELVAQHQFDEMHLVSAAETEIVKPIGRMDRRVRNLNDVSYDDIVASGDCRRRADAGLHSKFNYSRVFRKDQCHSLDHAWISCPDDSDDVVWFDSSPNK